MTRHFILSALLLSFAVSVMAQDDDMYFTPKKGNTANTVQRQQRSEVTEAYDYGNGVAVGNSTVTHSGSLRDVDEYNRRNRTGSEYSYGDDYAGGTQDSILVSRADYENSMKMKRFDGYNNITLVVNDPWYYDPWYYDSFYWRTRWYDPWYYSYYNPWHYGWGWHGYWGFHHGWGWGHTWHRPVIHRPVWGNSRPRPGIGNGRPARPSVNRYSSRSNRFSSNRTRTRSDRPVFSNTRTNTNNTNRSVNSDNTRRFSSSPSSGSSFSSGGSRSSFGGGGTRPAGGGGGSRSRVTRR